MSFNIQKRMILPIEEVEQLDCMAELAFAEGRDGKNAARRYRRLIQRIAGGKFLSHTYTHSGTMLVPNHVETYFGHHV